MLAGGCGTTKTRLATEQMIVSDAVDQAVADIDFRAMAGDKVYFDTQFIKKIKGIGFVNADYIISSLRQQMLAAGCRLQESRDEADFIVEARVGTLGTNGHEVVYGVPASNALSTAASFVSNTPSLPAIPEISLAKKDAQLGAAKVAVFAYDRETQRPVWQSGLSVAHSTAQDVWLFGAGPFQRGSIYDGTQFAGSKIHLPKLSDEEERPADSPVTYRDEFYFPRPRAVQRLRDIEVAGFDEELPPVVNAVAESESAEDTGNEADGGADDAEPETGMEE